LNRPGNLCRIAVFVSGGGSNFEAIAQAVERGEMPGTRIVLVVSSRTDAFALKRASNHNIESKVIDPGAFPGTEQFEDALLQELANYNVDVICLAGYLRKLGTRIIARYRGRILNIHPALLPRFGGPGMYGHFVHEAVINSGERESGCTVHVVDEEFDHGPIVAQDRVPVIPGDTPERLAARILEKEHVLYPRAINMFCQNLKKERKE
jgi:phosphoribosylglycinamide formyltransferase-1